MDTANHTFACEHPGCNKQYSGKSNLRKHILRCHGRCTSSAADAAPALDLNPPGLIKVVDQPSQNDYIALFMGEEDDQISEERSIIAFLSLPTEGLQVKISSLF